MPVSILAFSPSRIPNRRTGELSRQPTSSTIVGSSRLRQPTSSTNHSRTPNHRVTSAPASSNKLQISRRRSSSKKLPRLAVSSAPATPSLAVASAPPSPSVVRRRSSLLQFCPAAQV
nr:hypothetical protein Iba_chr02aCG11510 [Ipomoea batatas]